MDSPALCALRDGVLRAVPPLVKSPLFDAAVRAAGKKRAAPVVRLADPTLRTLPDPIREPYSRVGTILRQGDTRAVRVQEYLERAGWWLEVPGAEPRLAGDAEVRDMGAWAVEARAPGWKRDTTVVYVDLDGTGRKVYVGKRLAGSTVGLLKVTVGGKDYHLAAQGRHWPGQADDAADYYVVGTPSASRRSEAQKGRATLDADAQALFDGVVLAWVRVTGYGNADTTSGRLDREGVPFTAWSRDTVYVDDNAFDFGGISDAAAKAFEAAWTDNAKRKTMTAASLRRLERAGKVEERSPGHYVPVSSPFRSFTLGSLFALPAGTVLEAEDGQRWVRLSGEWFLLLPVRGSPVETRDVIGKLRVVSQDAPSLWSLLMQHATARTRADYGVEVTVLVPSAVRALLAPSIEAQDGPAFAESVLASARARTATPLPPVRPDAELSEGDGFIRAVFSPAQG